MNLFGAYLGGAVATYMEEYGLTYSGGSGFLIGLVSLIPLAGLTVLGFVLTSGGGLIESEALAGLGVLSGFFGGVFGLVSLFLAPIAGIAGGLSLGFYFHLIHKTND